MPETMLSNNIEEKDGQFFFRQFPVRIEVSGKSRSMWCNWCGCSRNMGKVHDEWDIEDTRRAVNEFIDIITEWGFGR